MKIYQLAAIVVVTFYNCFVNYDKISPKNKYFLLSFLEEIKDYFNNKKDEDYLEFDGHPLSDPDSLLDPSKPAPWDHLVNNEDDEDVDHLQQQRPGPSVSCVA